MYELVDQSISESVYRLNNLLFHLLNHLLNKLMFSLISLGDYSAPQNQDQEPVNLRWRLLPVSVLAGRPLPAFDSSTIDVTAHGCKTQSTSTSRESLPARCGNP